MLKNPASRPVAILALLLGLACVHRPTFAYDAPPGALAGLATVAVDPRQQLWKLDGQYSAEPWEFRQSVMEELHAKGFRFVQAGDADLWLDLMAFRPGKAPVQDAARNVPERGRRNLGQGARKAGEDPAPPRSSGDVTVIVRLVSRADEKVLWQGSMAVPGGKPAPDAPATPEDLVRHLLQPLPARGLKADAKVAN